MRLAVAYLFVAFAGLWASSTAASDPQGLYPVSPYDTGVWWEPARNGSGWYFSTLPGATAGGARLFTGAYYSYDPDGRANWMLFTGVRQSFTPRQQFETGLIARVSETLFESTGGACPTCPYAPPITVQSGYKKVEIVYTATTSAVVSFGDSAEIPAGTIRPIEFDVLRGQDVVLEGVWKGPRRAASEPTARECEIELVKRSPPYSHDRFEREDDTVLHIAAPGSQWFRAIFRPCGGASQQQELVAVRNADSGRVFLFYHMFIQPIGDPRGPMFPPVGAIFLSKSDSAANAFAVVFELYLTSERTAVARQWRNRVGGSFGEEWSLVKQ